MQLQKLIEKKHNLENITIKVNNDKSILLIDIMKLTKKLKYYVNNANTNKELIVALNKKYNFKNEFVSSFHVRTKFVNDIVNKIKRSLGFNRQLIIYLSEKQKYSTDSYSRYEKLILKRIKKSNTDFITIGDRAQEFCVENKLSVIRTFEKHKDDFKLATVLAKLIKVLYVENNYESVHMVINSNKNFNDTFCILPIQQFDVDKLLNIENKQTINNIEKFKIYPNIEKFVDAQVDIFLENAIQSLVVESSFYEAKNTLVNLNQISKQLDEDLLKINKKIIKLKREKEIEEIILLTKNNESFTLTGIEEE